MNADPNPAKAIFLEAVEQHTPDQWPAFLDRACSGQPELRGQVEALLGAHREVGTAHHREPEGADPSPVATIDLPPVAQAPGTVVGPYKLIEQIGEGGMGSVWMAQQTDPVKRLVVVKLIKPGMDSKQVLARFEAERQALAMMDHPNIARVLEAGTTDAGRPYFVMDLVRGVPITTYCDEHHLTPRQRLELFVPVCQAIQHAHQKGVIHRDLKPSNVLVALYDGRPVPKVIDFGIAKAAGQPLTDKTLFTGFGAIVGTPEYMSPEQAEVNQLDIDTRSDIYSLGVLLYELLAGSPPFSRKDLEKAGMLEMLRVIREQEPSKPSTKLSTAEGLPTLAANRGTEPAKLTRLVRGELDWIVMKALEKDRNRRYESANGFAADVQRYLADEPVQACPPSVGYRFRKFARRNKTALVMASVVGVAILLVVGSLGWMVRDREARHALTAVEVNQFLQRAEALYAENKLPEAVAEVEKARGVLESGSGDEELKRRVRQWLTDLDVVMKFEEMRQQSYDIADRDQEYADYARVFREYGIDVEALSVEEATSRIASSRINVPLADALGTWAGRLRQDPRSPDPARWQRLREIEVAADPDHFRVRLNRAAWAGDLKTLRELADKADVGRLRPEEPAWLGTALTWAGDPDAAVALLRKAQRQHPGDWRINESLARNLSQLKPPPWDEVIAFRRVVLALRPKSAAAHTALGYALQKKGRIGEAIDSDREAIRLNPKDSAIHLSLGQALRDQDKRNEANDAYREAVRLAPSDPYGHAVRGWALLELTQFAEAEQAFREVVRLRPDFAQGHFGLGQALQEQKKFVEAETVLREAIRLDPSSHYPHDALGWIHVHNGEFAKAELEFREVIRLRPETATGHFGLGRALVEQEKFADAETALRGVLRIEPTHRWAPGLLDRALVGQGKPPEAEKK